jgi:hypothetical protein
MFFIILIGDILLLHPNNENKLINGGNGWLPLRINRLRNKT